tara:strand:+ start:510 stop:1133 length:624 start_codon:yes stop_codon:yes gene_type:complete
MNTKTVNIETLSQDPANARSHSERNVESIKASLRAYGQQKPIVVNSKGVVIAGNGTLEAAKQLGWKEIGIVESDLQGAQAMAFAIADNRTAELASWDYPVLGEQVKALMDEGIDLETIGWLEHEVEPLLQADWTPPEVQPMDEDEGGHQQPGGNDQTTNVEVTSEQLEVIEEAVAMLREEISEPGIDLGLGVSRICQDWIHESKSSK